MIPDNVWREQIEFNALLRPELPANEHEVTEFLRDMSLNMTSELDELLRTTTWKRHRKINGHRPNREHRLEELIDQFKIWLTMVQGLGFTTEELTQAFWRKSMVVRQRHSEEWVKTLDRPTAVVDIDNVLCDYTTGFCDWLINRAPLVAKKAREIKRERRWFGKAADFGLTEVEWQGFKHEFRSGGHKRFLPTMPWAKEFLQAIRRAGYKIVLLTSRPIDRYPNIYTDTLFWLNDNQMIYDWVWWATDKGERLVESRALRNIKFVVDDDSRYIDQFLKLGLVSWHLQTTSRPYFPRDWEFDPEINSLVHVVNTLQDIVIPPLMEGEQYGV